MRFFILSLFVTDLLMAKPNCEVITKKIVVANKTDLKEEIEKNKKEGWKIRGKAIFKNWGYAQFFVKKICK